MTSRPPSRSILSALRMLLATLVVAAPLLVAPGHAAAAPTPSNTGATAGVDVMIDSVSPSVREDGSLDVTGRIVNDTEEAVRAPVARLGISSQLNSRQQVDLWSRQHDTSTLVATSTRTAQENDEAEEAEDAPVVPTLPDTLDPRSQTPFEFSIPADSLPGFRSEALSAWGPRGISMQVRTTDEDDIRTSATAAAYTVFFADPDLRPTEVSVLLPVTTSGLTDGTGLATPEDLEQAASAPDGRLYRLLDAIRGTRTGLAIDPQLIASIETALGEDPFAAAGGQAPTPEVEPPAAEDVPPQAPVDNLRAWYEAFQDEAGNHSIVALPWADPDLSVLRQDPLNDMRGSADEARSIVTDVFPEARTDVAFPVPGTVTRGLVTDEAEAGTNHLIVSDLQQPASTSYTGSAPSTMRAEGESIGTAVFDTGLSSALGGLDADQRGVLGGGPETDSPLTAASATSRLLAESAAITDERPYDPRRVLVAAPRDWNPEGDSLKQVLSQLEASPWTDTIDFSSLVDGEPVLRQSLVPSTRTGTLSTPGTAALAESLERTRTFSSALVDPSAAERDLDRALLSCTSARWVDNPDWGTCVDTVTAASDAVSSGITAEEGSPVLLVTGDRTNIPIRVTNDTPYDARVVVEISSPTPQLTTRSSEPLDIDAGGSTRVDVPVEGIANGDVATSVTVLGDDGARVSEPVQQLVRVRADWENIGTAVIGFGLVTVLVFGLVTSVRKGRRTVPKSQLEAAVAKASADDPG